MILHILIAMVAGWLQRHQQQVITYLLAENRILKAQLSGRRLRLTAIVFGSIFAWWRSFQMQPVDMGDQLHFTGPPAEVETEHLVRTFGRRTPDPQADQQAGDQ